MSNDPIARAKAQVESLARELAASPSWEGHRWDNLGAEWQDSFRRAAQSIIERYADPALVAEAERLRADLRDFDDAITTVRDENEACAKRIRALEAEAAEASLAESTQREIILRLEAENSKLRQSIAWLRRDAACWRKEARDLQIAQNGCSWGLSRNYSDDELELV